MDYLCGWKQGAGLVRSGAGGQVEEKEWLAWGLRCEHEEGVGPGEYQICVRDEEVEPENDRRSGSGEGEGQTMNEEHPTWCSQCHCLDHSHDHSHYDDEPPEHTNLKLNTEGQTTTTTTTATTAAAATTTTTTTTTATTATTTTTVPDLNNKIWYIHDRIFPETVDQGNAHTEGVKKSGIQWHVCT